MQTNKNGVPLWAIKRLLICRVNLVENGYKHFDITKDGSILFNDQYESHIDLIYYDESRESYCIPIAS